MKCGGTILFCCGMIFTLLGVGLLITGVVLPGGLKQGVFYVLYDSYAILGMGDQEVLDKMNDSKQKPSHYGEVILYNMKQDSGQWLTKETERITIDKLSQYFEFEVDSDSDVDATWVGFKTLSNYTIGEIYLDSTGDYMKAYDKINWFLKKDDKIKTLNLGQHGAWNELKKYSKLLGKGPYSAETGLTMAVMGKAVTTMWKGLLDFGGVARLGAMATLFPSIPGLAAVTVLENVYDQGKGALFQGTSWNLGISMYVSGLCSTASVNNLVATASHDAAVVGKVCACLADGLSAGSFGMYNTAYGLVLQNAAGAINDATMEIAFVNQCKTGTDTSYTLPAPAAGKKSAATLLKETLLQHQHLTTFYQQMKALSSTALYSHATLFPFAHLSLYFRSSYFDALFPTNTELLAFVNVANAGSIYSQMSTDPSKDNTLVWTTAWKNFLKAIKTNKVTQKTPSNYVCIGSTPQDDLATFQGACDATCTKGLAVKYKTLFKPIFDLYKAAPFNLATFDYADDDKLNAVFQLASYFYDAQMMNLISLQTYFPTTLTGPLAIYAPAAPIATPPTTVAERKDFFESLGRMFATIWNTSTSFGMLGSKTLAGFLHPATPLSGTPGYSQIFGALYAKSMTSYEQFIVEKCMRQTFKASMSMVANQYAGINGGVPNVSNLLAVATGGLVPLANGFEVKSLVKAFDHSSVTGAQLGKLFDWIAPTTANMAAISPFSPTSWWWDAKNTKAVVTFAMQIAASGNVDAALAANPNYKAIWDSESFDNVQKDFLKWTALWVLNVFQAKKSATLATFYDATGEGGIVPTVDYLIGCNSGFGIIDHQFEMNQWVGARVLDATNQCKTGGSIGDIQAGIAPFEIACGIARNPATKPLLPLFNQLVDEPFGLLDILKSTPTDANAPIEKVFTKSGVAAATVFYQKNFDKSYLAKVGPLLAKVMAGGTLTDSERKTKCKIQAGAAYNALVGEKDANCLSMYFLAEYAKGVVNANAISVWAAAGGGPVIEKTLEDIVFSGYKDPAYQMLTGDTKKKVALMEKGGLNKNLTDVTSFEYYTGASATPAKPAQIDKEFWNFNFWHKSRSVNGNKTVDNGNVGVKVDDGYQFPDHVPSFDFEESGETEWKKSGAETIKFFFDAPFSRVATFKKAKDLVKSPHGNFNDLIHYELDDFQKIPSLDNPAYKNMWNCQQSFGFPFYAGLYNYGPGFNKTFMLERVKKDSLTWTDKEEVTYDEETDSVFTDIHPVVGRGLKAQAAFTFYMEVDAFDWNIYYPGTFKDKKLFPIFHLIRGGKASAEEENTIQLGFSGIALLGLVGTGLTGGGAALLVVGLVCILMGCKSKKSAVGTA